MVRDAQTQTHSRWMTFPPAAEEVRLFVQGWGIDRLLLYEACRMVARFHGQDGSEHSTTALKTNMDSGTTGL